MNFLQELAESRMYRRLGQLEGKNIHDIAERLFEHLLALQIFANENRDLAARYAKTVMKQQAFDGFRTSMPDLYNLIALIQNQNQYSHIVITDETVSIPELRLRRNLRQLATGGFDNNDYSQMMLMLQRRFEKLPGILVQLRRQISDWKNVGKDNRRSMVRRLLTQMRERGMQSDFYYHLEKLT